MLALGALPLLRITRKLRVGLQGLKVVIEFFELALGTQLVNALLAVLVLVVALSRLLRLQRAPGLPAGGG